MLIVVEIQLDFCVNAAAFSLFLYLKWLELHILYLSFLPQIDRQAHQPKNDSK